MIKLALIDTLLQKNIAGFTVTLVASKLNQKLLKGVNVESALWKKYPLKGVKPNNHLYHIVSDIYVSTCLNEIGSQVRK